MTKSNPLIIEEDNSTIFSQIEQPKESSNEKNIEQLSKQFIPNEYIPIYLSSEGRLGNPKILHFRDYSMDDALEINVVNEEDSLKAFVEVLNRLVWEDFDCRELHVNEMMEILYTLHANFVGTSIEKNYYLDEDLPVGTENGQLNHKDNIVTIDLPLKCIAKHSINEDQNGKKWPIDKMFKEPFSIKDKDTKIKIYFRLTRLKDMLFAQEYCKKKYIDQEKEFLFVKKTLEKIRSIKDEEERKAKLDELVDNDENDLFQNYYNYKVQYEKDYARIIQSCVIEKLVEYINGKETITIPSTIEEKLDIYKNKISKDMWPEYNEVIEKYDFGIVEKATFFSDKLQKNITRRFQFQYLDFVSTRPKENSRRFDMSFD